MSEPEVKMLNVVVEQDASLEDVQKFMTSLLKIRRHDARVVFVKSRSIQQVIDYAKKFADAAGHKELVSVVESEDEIPTDQFKISMKNSGIFDAAKRIYFQTQKRESSSASGKIAVPVLQQKEVFFKIIVPNYNNMSYIKKCLDSILEQTFQDFTIVIVNYNCDDNSDKLAKQYSKSYSQKICSIDIHSKNDLHSVFRNDESWTLTVNSNAILDKNVLDTLHSRIVNQHIDSEKCLSFDNNRIVKDENVEDNRIFNSFSSYNYCIHSSKLDVVFLYQFMSNNKIHLTDELITVVLATFPPRYAGVSSTIESIYHQCDQLIVCLNQYEVVPQSLPKYKNIKYVLAGPKQRIPDLGCNNKMAWLGRFPGYYFTIDDDIIYPHDYCKTVVRHMKVFNNSVICSYEGRTYTIKNGKPVTMDFNKCKAFSFIKGYSDYNVLHRAGGGVMCMYPEKLPFNYVNYTSMPKNSGDDEITSVLCQKYNVKLIRPPSTAGYLNMNRSNTFIQALHMNVKGVSQRKQYMMQYDKWRSASMNVDLGYVKYKNLGDSVSDIVVKNISNNNVNKIWLYESGRRPCILTIGSILQPQFVHDGDVVWGSGCISDEDQHQLKLNTKIKVLCVRGPLTRKQLLCKNIQCNEVYGDPGIFIPYAFGFKRNNLCKKYKIGIIPHVEDFDDVRKRIKRNDVLLIDFRTDPAKCLQQISICERIISSSLHGIIISEAFGIPAAWAKFSNKIVGGAFKFNDYYLGSGRKLIDVKCMDWMNDIAIGTETYMPKAKYNIIGMLDSAPFAIDEHKKQLIIDWFK